MAGKFWPPYIDNYVLFLVYLFKYEFLISKIIQSQQFYIFFNLAASDQLYLTLKNNNVSTLTE